MKRTLIFAVLSLLVVSALLTGCAQPPAGPAGATDLDDDFKALEELDTDLDIAELDSLDKEFADLEAMFS